MNLCLQLVEAAAALGARVVWVLSQGQALFLFVFQSPVWSEAAAAAEMAAL